MTKQMETLQNLGLSQDEAQTYIALLKHDGISASALALEIGVKRTTIYAIIDSLVKKGFALMYVKQGKRVYRPQKPQRVASLVQQKVEQFTDIIPALETLEKKQAQAIGLRFLETKKEIVDFYLTMLDEKKGGSYDIIGSQRDWSAIDKDFLTAIQKKIVKNDISVRLVLSGDSSEVADDYPKNLLQTKFLPSKYTFRSTIDIFDTSILLVSPQLNALAVVIEIPAMVDVFKAVFEMLWDTVAKEKK